MNAIIEYLDSYLLRTAQERITQTVNNLDTYFHHQMLSLKC